VCSHGHFDHTTGIDGLIRAVGRVNLPVLIHPHFWRRRRLQLPGREPQEIPTTSRSALAGAGFDIIEERQPSFLFDRSVLITGEVARTTGYEPGFPPQQAWLDGSWQPDPLVLDDQALIVNVRDRGLVVIAADRGRRTAGPRDRHPEHVRGVSRPAGPRSRPGPGPGTRPGALAAPARQQAQADEQGRDDDHGQPGRQRQVPRPVPGRPPVGAAVAHRAALVRSRRCGHLFFTGYRAARVGERVPQRRGALRPRRRVGRYPRA
jgi:hypothetical protein